MNDINAEHSEARDAQPNRRRGYLVNAAFQWRYALTISAAVFLVSSIISSVLYAVLHHQARMRIVNPESYSGEVTLIVFFASVVFAALTAGGVGLWFVVITHRICGPLVVLEKHIAELTRGRFPTMRSLRRKDEFKELYEAFRKAVDSLKQRKRRELVELEEALKTAEMAVNSDDETREKALQSLTRTVTQLRDMAAAALAEQPMGEDADQAAMVVAAPEETAGVL